MEAVSPDTIALNLNGFISPLVHTAIVATRAVVLSLALTYSFRACKCMLTLFLVVSVFNIVYNLEFWYFTVKMGKMSNGNAILFKEWTRIGGFPFAELYAVKKPELENQDASETEDDDEQDGDDSQDDDDEDDMEDDDDEEEEDVEANADGGSDDSDEDDDSDDEEDEDDDEDEEKDEKETPQPPVKKRK